jgi:hypothetical protein
MSTLPNEAAELLHEFSTAQVWTANPSKLAKRSRRNAVLEGKVCDVNGDTIPMQRTRDRDDDAGYPTQEKNGAFQRIPYLPAGKLDNPNGQARL